MAVYPVQVGAHRLHRALGVPGRESGDEFHVVSLVQLAAFPRGAAAFQVAPEVPVPRRLDDAVEPGEQRAVAGRYDAAVQGQVPGLELVIAAGLVTPGQ